MDRSHAYDDLELVEDEVPVTPPALANDVSEDDLLSQQLVDGGPPPLEADDSSLIGTFPRPIRVPGPTSPPSNASTAALSGLTSSVRFTISAHPPVSHGVLATPSTSGRATSGARPAGDTANDESAETGDSDLPSLQSVFDSLSDEGDDDVLVVREPAEEAEPASSHAPHNHAVPTSSTGVGATPDVRPTPNVFRGTSQSSLELREGARVLIPASDPPGWLSEFANRHGLTESASSDRAEALIKCMEVVPDELAARYEKLRSADSEGVDGCAICQDDLVSKSPDTAEVPVPHASASVAFPCAGKHLFHTHCLLPWLAQKTTCPSCRFDIDPHRRILWGFPRVWQPPLVESMRDWLAAEEKAKETGVRRERPGVVIPEYPAIPPPPPPPPTGADLDSNLLSLNFEEFGDLDVLMSGSESRLTFERDFAAWFDPENATSL